MNKQKDEQKFFISRRGKQVGIHQLDLTGIDIESKETVPIAQTSLKKPKKSKNQKTYQKVSTWSQRKGIIAVAVFAVLALPIVLAEIVTVQYKSGMSNAQQDLEALIRSSVLPTQQKANVSSNEIGSLAQEVGDIANRMCRGGLVDNAAGLYPRAKTALSSCKQSQHRYITLERNLLELESETKYLEKVDDIIKPVATAITDQYAVIGAQQTAWSTAAREIVKLSTPSTMKSAHDNLSSHIIAASEAWARLSTAHNEQDAQGFEEAEQALHNEYDAIRSTSSAFTEVLAYTQAKIIRSYNELK